MVTLTARPGVSEEREGRRYTAHSMAWHRPTPSPCPSGTLTPYVEEGDVRGGVGSPLLLPVGLN